MFAQRRRRDLTTNQLRETPHAMGIKANCSPGDYVERNALDLLIEADRMFRTDPMQAADILYLAALHYASRNQVDRVESVFDTIRRRCPGYNPEMRGYGQFGCPPRHDPVAPRKHEFRDTHQKVNFPFWADRFNRPATSIK